MWSNFYADQQCSNSSTVVGIVDSDSFLSTFVTPQAILERTSNDTRPRVRAIGRNYGAYSFGTYDALGLKQRASFMINFPLWLHRSTFAVARNAIALHLNASTFDEAWATLLKRWKAEHYSQFNILLNAAFYHQHELYDWHFEWQSRTDGSPEPFIRVGRHWNPPTSRFALERHYLWRGCCFCIKAWEKAMASASRSTNTSERQCAHIELQPTPPEMNNTAVMEQHRRFRDESRNGTLHLELAQWYVRDRLWASVDDAVAALDRHYDAVGALWLKHPENAENCIALMRNTEQQQQRRRRRHT
jgi:hypothetical protein